MKTRNISIGLILVLILASIKAPAQKNTLKTEVLSTELHQADENLWSLHDCMAYGVKHALTLKVKELSNKDHSINKKEAVLDFLPSVNGYVSGTSSWGRSISPETNTYDDINIINNYYSLTASLTLFNGFETINNYKIAQIAEKIGLSEKQLLQDDLCITIAKAYSEVVYRTGLVSITRNTLDNSLDDLKRTKVMNTLGLNSETDVLEMQAQYLSDTLNFIRANNDLQKAERTLKTYLNYPQEERISLVQDILVEQAPELDPKENQGQGLEHNPEQTDASGPNTSAPNHQAAVETALHHNLRFLNASEKVRTSQLKYRTSRWQLLPKIDLQGGYNTNYIYNPDAQYNTDYWNQFENQAGQYIGISMTIPIFNAGYNFHQKSKLHHAYIRDQYEKQIIEREVTDEILQAMNDAEAAKAEYLMSVKKASTRIKAHAVNRKQYAEGLINVLDLNKSAVLEAEAKAESLNMLLTYHLKTMIVKYYQGISYLDQN